MFNQILEFAGANDLYFNFNINKLAKKTRIDDYLEIKCLPTCVSTPGILYNQLFQFKVNKVYCIEVLAESLDNSKPFIFLGNDHTGGNYVKRTYISNELKSYFILFYCTFNINGRVGVLFEQGKEALGLE